MDVNAILSWVCKLVEHDYPAAHSMDTTWYAMDKNGHLAMFHSGESGAVPNCATRNIEWEYNNRDNFPTCTSQVMMAGYIWRFGRQHQRMAPTDAPNRTFFCYLSSTAGIDGILESAPVNAYIDHKQRCVAVVLRPDQWQQAHDLGLCLGCTRLSDWRYTGRVLQNGVVTPEVLYHTNAVDGASLGLFRYEHLTDNWSSGPYGLARVPDRPLHIDMLPPSERTVFRQCRFDNIAFTEVTVFNPIEHLESYCYEQSFIPTDCNIELDRDKIDQYLAIRGLYPGLTYQAMVDQAVADGVASIAELEALKHRKE